MTLPSLANWARTRTALHQATQVIGAARAAVASPEPNWTHLGLYVTAHGVTTGTLPGLGELALDFGRRRLAGQLPNREPFSFSLAEHSQITLADALEKTLAEAGHTLAFKRDPITGTELLTPDEATATDYAQVLWLLTETIGRFRESLPGAKSRLVVWPHGFDVSFLWFATEQASEQAPHMAFGFSPYSAGLERPYIYTYAYPVPAGMTKLAPPTLTRWHADGWTGTVTDYDALREESDPVAALADVLADVYAKVSPLLGRA